MTPEAPASGGTDPPSTVRNALRTVGSVVAPTTLIAALLYWFGEVRIRTQAQDLGLDHSVFGFSNQDYIRRSVSSLYLPLGIILLVALTWLSAHWVLCRWAAPARTGAAETACRKRLWAVVLATAATGLVCFVAGSYGAFATSPSEPVWSPVGLGLGVALTSYAAHVWRRFIDRSPIPRPGASDLGWVAPLSATLVALLVAVALFWAISDYAVAVGHGLTDQLVAEDLARRPDVVVYSERRLHIGAAGVEETRLGEGDEPGYRYRYDGLKLLLFSAGKYFLLPTSWEPGVEPAIVLRDDDSLRVEFLR